MGKTYYVVCQWNSHYNFHHSDVGTAWHIADGLQEAEKCAKVLWGGGSEIVNGIMHENYGTVRPEATDTLIVVGQTWATTVRENPEYAHLRVPQERWWYAYDHHGGECGGFWKHIFNEGMGWVDQARLRTPDAQLHWSMPGVVHDVDLSKPSPYEAGTKNLFFAGRMMIMGGQEHHTQFSFIREFMELLPSNYRVWLASASMYIPKPTEMAYDPSVLHPLMAGKTVHLVPGQTIWEAPSSTETYGPPSEGIPMINNMLGDSRIRYIGPKSYGTFWEYYHHAHACLDFGLHIFPFSPNCKVMDPLRSGTLISADGLSPSHYLIHKHAAGKVCQYRDARAMADNIRSFPTESPTDKIERANRIVNDDSWRVRVRSMLRMVEN